MKVNYIYIFTLPAASSDRPYNNDIKPIILFMIPDGKTKAMSGISGKLAQR
jgi:hypothetical protein